MKKIFLLILFVFIGFLHSLFAQEMEIGEVFAVGSSKKFKISAFLSVNPEFTSFEKFGTMGSSEPYFIAWLNSGFGLRYSLKGIKEK